MSFAAIAAIFLRLPRKFMMRTAMGALQGIGSTMTINPSLDGLSFRKLK
jgi:hypothetical protein